MCFLIGVGQMLVWWLIHHRFVLVPWIVAKPPRCKHTLTNQLHMISISNILRLFQFQSSALKAFYGVKSRPLLSSGLKPLIFICTSHQNPGGHQRPWCQCLQRSMVPPWGALALATWPMIFWFHEFLLISLQLCCHSVLFLAALYDPEGSQSLSQTDSKFISLMPSLFLPPLKLWTLYYILLLCQYCWWPKQTAKFRSSKADGFSKSVVCSIELGTCCSRWGTNRNNIEITLNRHSELVRPTLRLRFVAASYGRHTCESIHQWYWWFVESNSKIFPNPQNVASMAVNDLD